MKFQFDPHQQYQQDAIAAVIDLFDGQPSDARQLISGFTDSHNNGSQGVLNLRIESTNLNLGTEIGAQGNNLLLDDATLLSNLQRVQEHNGLDINTELIDGKQFDIEMETGTGKTYVYLRTAFELARHYNFLKYIILVPSVAIREGVKTSFENMKEHFQQLYPGVNYNVNVYAGAKASDIVQSFATTNTLQFMILTIDSLRGKKDTLIMTQPRDDIGGRRPIDYLAATQPIVIMDEPQNMESQLAQSAIANLNPLCTLRYSATHRVTRNVVYRLDPLDAHQLGLVKTIVVSDAQDLGSTAKPYVKLLEVKREPTFKAKLELVCRKQDGTYAKRTVNARQGDDLMHLSGENAAYENNWRINEISVLPEQIELSNYGILRVGETIGSNQDAVFKEMIRETIREHLRKEIQVHTKGIKVLSLFFIDKVASYLGSGFNNTDANGNFATWFDELYTVELAKFPKAQAFMPSQPQNARSGYFAQMKLKGKNAPITFKDSSGTTVADNDAYELIMKDKGRLLSMDEPVRFIFSHSALREGWDNPNVFQICTLRDMTSETERRQTIGRGLRLPVNQLGERIADSGLAQLTVVANESYQAFASALQDEYQKAGVTIGIVRRIAFARILMEENGKTTTLGSQRSGEIWDCLHLHGYIDDNGEVTRTWTPEELSFKLNLPPQYASCESEVISIVDNCKIEKIIKRKRKRVTRTFNKQVYASAEFEEFWEKISQRTTYRVSFDRNKLVSTCITRIKNAPRIEPMHIQITRTGLKLTRSGAHGSVLGVRTQDLVDSYPLPDIISQLQESTSLTRKTIIDILVGSNRLQDFVANPNDYIKMVSTCIQEELAEILVEGIQYEPIAGSIYELRELQADGLEEKDRFLDQLYKVTNTEKTDYNYVVLDSAVEREFAKYLDNREDIKLFMKLPDKFRIPTPVGNYNPDWAIIKVENGSEHLYLIRETKSSLDPKKRRPSENAKINAAIKHFAAIGVDYEVSTPERWEI